MSNLQPRLDVFDKIPKDKIIKLGEFFDESIILTEPDNSKIREIVGDDFRDDDIEKIKFVFFDFVMVKITSERIFEMINKSQLGEEKKTSLKEIIKELYTKINSDKLALNLQCRNLGTLSHYKSNTDRISRNIPTDENVSNDENSKNERVFKDFLKNNLNNPEFKDKFVAIVNGEFQDVGDEITALVKKMYAKFGHVDMYVDKITDQKEIIHIHTPRFT